MTKRILVAPLDWGLGHATRCIPIIRELLDQGAAPFLASNGQARTLLQQEFPKLPLLDLPAYDIRYPSRHMAWNLVLQLPRLVRTILAEHRVLARYIRQYQLHGVISDNRFGCFSGRVPCVFITHQVNIRTGLPVVQGMVRAVNHAFIRRYSSCWIPDVPDAPGLADALSHPAPPVPTRYIGYLSRLQRREPSGESYDLLFLLSGPEPQRSLLETRLLDQARRRPEKMLLVRGRPELAGQEEEQDRLRVVGFLNAETLERVLSNSRLVVCRSGYSTLMDLARLNCRAILIPTPGQTEQEYLAERLFAAGRCYTEPQARFDLHQALDRAEGFRGLAGLDTGASALLSRAVSRFLTEVETTGKDRVR